MARRALPATLDDFEAEAQASPGARTGAQSPTRQAVCFAPRCRRFKGIWLKPTLTFIN